MAKHVSFNTIISLREFYKDLPASSVQKLITRASGLKNPKIPMAMVMRYRYRRALAARAHILRARVLKLALNKMARNHVSPYSTDPLIQDVFSDEVETEKDYDESVEDSSDYADESLCFSPEDKESSEPVLRAKTSPVLVRSPLSPSQFGQVAIPRSSYLLSTNQNPFATIADDSVPRNLALSTATSVDNSRYQDLFEYALDASFRA